MFLNVVDGSRFETQVVLGNTLRLKPAKNSKPKPKDAGAAALAARRARTARVAQNKPQFLPHACDAIFATKLRQGAQRVRRAPRAQSARDAICRDNSRKKNKRQKTTGNPHHLRALRKNKDKATWGHPLSGTKRTKRKMSYTVRQHQVSQTIAQYM